MQAFSPWRSALLARVHRARRQFASGASEGRLVVRVLRHELAGERLFEDRLPQTLSGLQLGGEVGFEAIDDGELDVNDFDNSPLLDQRRKSQRESL